MNSAAMRKVGYLHFTLTFFPNRSLQVISIISLLEHHQSVRGAGVADQGSFQRVKLYYGIRNFYGECVTVESQNGRGLCTWKYNRTCQRTAMW